MNGFSIILPTVKASNELDLCLESIKQNSRLENELIVLIDRDIDNEINKNILEVLKKRNINFIVNKKNIGPYASWNKGAGKAKKKLLCFITDDQYFAPGWDSALMRYTNRSRILSGQLIEAGVLPPSFPTIIKDFGESAVNFKKESFVKFANKIKKDKLVEGQFFIPLVISRANFFKVGMFPTSGHFGKKGKPNDALFIKKAKKKGLDFKSSLSSISYHFQGSSWVRNRKISKFKNKIKILIKQYTQFNPLNIDMRLRYDPLIYLIKKFRKSNDNILEVGSGRLGITAFLREKITGLDLSFDKPFSQYIKPVIYSGKKFPFKDSQFDWVICLDCLEHIPVSKRRYFVHELVRIAKKHLILGFPEGERAFQQDRYFLKRQNKFYIKSNALKEHVEFGPIIIDDIISMMKESGKKAFKTKVVKNTNLKLHFFIRFLSISKHRLLNYLFRLMYFFHPLIKIFSNRGECYRKIIFCQFKK